jgi:hypothetical protein
LNQPSVLIISDDTDFARTVAARWQSERHVPEVTLATSDVCHSTGFFACDLVIIGPVQAGKLRSIISAVGPSHSTAVVHVLDGGDNGSDLQARHPHLLVVPKRDGWAETLILVSIEALRRVEASNRAQRAEHHSQACQRHAILGRYMLEMRPSVNNALTSVLGNADLLLLEPGQNSGESREQIRAIQAMALRLNEIMQRFSSLASEMRSDEKESQAETEAAASGFAVTP